jgi:hypothetical protein
MARPWLALLVVSGCALAYPAMRSERDGLVLDPDGAAGAATASAASERAIADAPHGSASISPAGHGGTFGLSRSELWAYWNALRGDPYDLDNIERLIAESTKLECPKDLMVNYSGTSIRYHGAVKVAPAFRERLVRFEEVVNEVAREVYGREPIRVHHFGAFNCRSTRNKSHRMSEHALGNAIDIVGFDFGPAKKQSPPPDALPRPLRNSFQVRVVRHWNGQKTEIERLHSAFLRELTRRLVERRDVFRGFVGPSRKDHQDHLHFDVAPWRYVRL